MHGAVDHGGGGAAAGQFIEEETGDVGRVFGIGEFSFGREGVLFQPWQQAGRRRGDHVRLRIVYVGVDKTGHDDIAAIVVQRRTLRKEGDQLAEVAGQVDFAVV